MNLVLRFVAGLLSLARELSDETAYRRYLQKKGSAPSCAEWRLFSEDRYLKKFGNAKCC